jgi:hypothetical protein
MPSRSPQPTIASEVHIEDVSDAFDTSDVFDDEQSDFYDTVATDRWEPTYASDVYDDEAAL